ncbi:MAG: hypothetical protein ABI343_05435 [Burkholderiaceae bacterium]
MTDVTTDRPSRQARTSMHSPLGVNFDALSHETCRRMTSPARSLVAVWSRARSICSLIVQRRAIAHGACAASGATEIIEAALSWI